MASTTTQYPDLCIEVHRYDDPDTFRFFKMQLRTTEQPGEAIHVWPFGDAQVDLGPVYVETDRQQVRDDLAAHCRDSLNDDGYRPMEFMEVPTCLARMIVGNYVPIEWKPNARRIDEELTGRITVWVRGEMPKL